jgi:hypothetical protein
LRGAEGAQLEVVDRDRSLHIIIFLVVEWWPVPECPSMNHQQFPRLSFAEKAHLEYHQKHPVRIGVAAVRRRAWPRSALVPGRKLFRDGVIGDAGEHGGVFRRSLGPDYAIF